MKIKKSDIKIAVALLMFVAALVSYFVCANKIKPNTEAVKTECATLESEVAYLQDLMDHKEEYIKETDDMKAEIEEIKSQFPGEIRAEVQIMYANDLELKHAIVVDSVALGEAEILTAAEAAAPVEPQLDENGNPIETAEAAPATPAISLSRNISTVAFKSTYKSIKDIILMINEDFTMKKSIQSLALAYDQTTGNLTGTLAMSMFSMGGIDKEYTGPNLNGVRKGSTNPFNTTESVATLRSSTTDLSAVGAMEQANAPTDGAKADERESDSDEEQSQEQ